LRGVTKLTKMDKKTISKYQNKIFKWYKEKLGFDKVYNIHSIDISKPWYFIFKPYWLTFTFTIISEGVVWGFMTYAPVYLGQHFEQPQLGIEWKFCLVFIVVWAVKNWNKYYYARDISNLMGGLEIAAFSYFLKCDPIHHASRSLGIMLSKIKKAVSNTETICDTISFEFVPLIVKIIVISISFFMVSIPLGLISCGMLSTVVILSCAAQSLSVGVFVPPEIEAENSLAKRTVDALTHYSIIRATFTTTDHINEINQEAKGYIATISAASYGLTSTLFLPRLVYIFSCGLLLAKLTNMVTVGSLEVGLAVGLMAAYFSAFKFLLSSGKKLAKYLKAVVKVKDLFDYSAKFGNQTIPLEILENQSIELSNLISKTGGGVKFHKLSIGYDIKKPIIKDFNHVFNPISKHGLFGIVGHSGIGKSTLLKTLAGELRPLYGNVYVNSMDIYTISEAHRKQTLVIQQQEGAAMSGTVERNLLQGLKNRDISDSELKDLLKRVNLWSVLEHTKGLKSSVGELGVTLSGGQRQRLNFASMWLRAHYLNPQVVCLDEPTSALDKITAVEITKMIQELSQKSIVIMVAHNDNVLRFADEVLDLSQHV
jgi:ABC-type multidrug transport system fused ATPase/permease subunit